jgi:hypothetical protein
MGIKLKYPTSSVAPVVGFCHTTSMMHPALPVKSTGIRYGAQEVVTGMNGLITLPGVAHVPEPESSALILRVKLRVPVALRLALMMY